MNRRTVLLTVVVAVLGVGVGTAVGSAGSARSDKQVVMAERRAIDSASTLAGFSSYVVGGTFTAVAGSGAASAYGLGGPNEPRVQLWNFHVDRVFKGSGPTDVLVVRYDPAKVASEETPVSKGMSAVVFLTPELEGARAVVGGDQGLLLRSGRGGLAPISAQTTALAGASTQDALAVAVK